MISFLDVLVTRQVHIQKGTTCTTQFTGVCKNLTDTNKHIHNIPHHPKHQKLAVAKILNQRANTRFSNINHFPRKLLHVPSIWSPKGFKARVTYFSSHQPQTNATKPTYAVFIYFISDISKKIRQVLS